MFADIGHGTVSVCLWEFKKILLLQDPPFIQLKNTNDNKMDEWNTTIV